MEYKFLSRSEIFGNDIALLREELTKARGRLSEILTDENIEAKMETADAVLVEPLDSRFRTHPSRLVGYNLHVESLMQRKDELSVEARRFMQYILDMESAVFNLCVYNGEKELSGKGFLSYLGVRASVPRVVKATKLEEALVA